MARIMRSAVGFFAELYTRLDEELERLGVADEAIEDVTKRKNRGVIEEMAKVMASVIADSAKRIFSFVIKPGETTKQVVSATQHVYVNPAVNSENLPMRGTVVGERKLAFIDGTDFDHDPTSEEVLAEAKRRGLIRPTHEDALWFDREFPNEHGWFVFLHEPWQGPNGDLRVVCLRRGGADRGVDLDLFADRWHRGSRFGFLCKS